MILAVVGPTASGKSDFALDLADLYAARIQVSAPEAVEIISADAMQLYRGMDIGTAKLPLAERRGIAHHQIDVLDVMDEASVAKYQKDARADIATIKRSEKLPMVVGGSGLYVRALLDDMRFPPTDTAIRERLEERLARLGAETLHRELSELDPEAARHINPKNGRRVVRALEVIEATGEPFSATLPKRQYVEPAVQIGIRRETEELEERIRRRTTAMFDQGLVEEVSRLRDLGLGDSKTAARATGYSQVLAMLDGQINENEARESITLATTQLAKRQIKWFRADPRITWVNGTDSAWLRLALDILLNAQDSEALL
ncbi:MAG: tRNA (adenosine(37)-N6)-dimethylallyltransferase MiaA [Scrofimicrobium sp.]